MKTNKADLAHFFTEFNTKYFNRRLPKCEVVFAPKTKLAHLGGYNPNPYYKVDELEDKDAVPHSYGHRIRLSSSIRFSRCLVLTTLLHEMVHLDGFVKEVIKSKDVVRELKKWWRRNGHGHVFNNEMKRLANAGAFNGLW